MAAKLKCGSTFSSISWISLLRLPRISLSLAMSSTTSSVTFFTSTSGVNSWPCALPSRKAAKRHRTALAIVRMFCSHHGFVVLGNARQDHAINVRRRLDVDGRPETALFLNAFLTRRLSIIDQAPAALQVGVALEYVLVERRLLQDAARVQQIGAHIDQAQRDRGIAQPDRPEIADRIGIDVGRGSNAVAQRARAENRQHEIRTVANAPAAQGLAKILVVLLDPHVGRHIVNAQQPAGAVEGEARPVHHAVLELALQQVVDADEKVADVGKEIAHPAADLLVQQVVISRRHRLGDRLVDGLVELVDAAVEPFERIAWIAVRAGACRQNREQHDAAREPHFAGSLAGSAALLNRNWLMRFSSTTADWVRRRRSPFFSITPSPPASSPTYCSPRIPEVRILAVVSRGNW